MAALESKIAVLEKKLDYANFNVKIADDERLKAISKMHEAESALVEERMKSRNTEFALNNREMQNGPKFGIYSNNISDQYYSSNTYVHSNASGKDIAAAWNDPARKEELKQRLKLKLMHQKSTRGRSLARSPYKDEYQEPVDNLPFVVGKVFVYTCYTHTYMYVIESNAL